METVSGVVKVVGVDAVSSAIGTVGFGGGIVEKLAGSAHTGRVANGEAMAREHCPIGNCEKNWDHVAVCVTMSPWEESPKRVQERKLAYLGKDEA